MSVLRRRDHTHPDPRVRLAGGREDHGPEQLVEVACTDESPRVRLTAVSRLTTTTTWRRVARRPQSLDVRLVAVERIFSQGVVADLLKSARKPRADRHVLFADHRRRIIESIAQDPDYSPVVRRMAVEYFADESYLAEARPRREATAEERKSEEAVRGLRRGLRRWAARRAGDRQVPAQREGAASARDDRPQGRRDRRAGRGVPVLGPGQRQPEAGRSAPRRSSRCSATPISSTASSGRWTTRPSRADPRGARSRSTRPRRGPRSGQSRSTTSGPSEGDAMAKKILIIDDEKDMRVYLEAALPQGGLRHRDRVQRRGGPVAGRGPPTRPHHARRPDAEEIGRQGLPRPAHLAEDQGRSRSWCSPV